MRGMSVNPSGVVTVESLDWIFEYDDIGDMEISSPDGKALILIGAYDFARSPSLDELGELLSESKGDQPLTEIELGDYYGVTYSYVDPGDDVLVGEYLVSLAEVVLELTVSCPVESQDQYLSDLKQILSSLHDKRP